MENRTKNILTLFAGLTIVGFVVTIVFVMNVPTTFGQTQKALVDLNKASEKELEALPGVGPATSKKIVANRPYKSSEELSKAGLSAKAIETLKPLVTVGSVTTPKEPAAKASAPVAPAKAAPVTTAPATVQKPATPSAKLAPGQKVNINSASKEQLDALPGIGPVKAQAIIDGRPYAKTEDIMKVKGIKQGEFNKIKDLISVK